MDSKRYEIGGRFISYGKRMIIIKLDHSTHVMPEDEWKWVFGQLRPERWKNGARVKRNRKSA